MTRPRPTAAPPRVEPTRRHGAYVAVLLAACLAMAAAAADAATRLPATPTLPPLTHPVDITPLHQ